MHRIPNSWGIQTMNTCLHSAARSGMHNDLCSVWVLLLYRHLIWWEQTGLTNGGLNFCLCAGNCLTLQLSELYTPRMLQENADLRKNDSKPDAYYLATYKNLHRPLYYQAWPCLYILPTCKILPDLTQSFQDCHHLFSHHSFKRNSQTPLHTPVFYQNLTSYFTLAPHLYLYTHIRKSYSISYH